MFTALMTEGGWKEEKRKKEGGKKEGERQYEKELIGQRGKGKEPIPHNTFHENIKCTRQVLHKAFHENYLT